VTGPRTIERVDVADEPALRIAYETILAGYSGDDPGLVFPTFPEQLALARAPERVSRFEFWLARDGAGRPVGAYRLQLPLRDNPDLAEVFLAVAPADQRRGHGRALAEHVRTRAAEQDRHRLVVSVMEPPDGGQSRSTRFAAATGAVRSLGEVRRTLHLDEVDRARLARLRSEAEQAATGYELVSWTGRCPDELVDGYAALIGRMSTDAPLGDLGIEPESWDADRVRDREAVMAAQGRTQLATAVRRADDGAMVAYTDLVLTEHDPENAFQWDTLVRTEDRGHRLGTLAKVANLQRLLDAGTTARRIHTWNADTNTFMIAINEAMGFVPVARESAWQLDLPRSGEDVDA
jgi:GNAT superfamily N-acetyltransferase